VEYVGRFAPSPTGPLHAGSVATAVASFLHARQRHGSWLLRIDDLDPPRSVPGSAQSIVNCLERLHLHWDGRVYYQSERRQAHAEVAARLIDATLAFRCACSRSQLTGANEAGELGIRYSGHCRDRKLSSGETATRILVRPGEVRFVDGLQGLQRVDLSREIGDYVIFRRDGFPAYHLAAVLDDADQGVTHVVRGCDLLAVTAIHVHLARLLELPSVEYLHVPVLCDASGVKLSKRHRSASVAELSATDIAFAALTHIGADPPADLASAPLDALWQWAIENWRIEALTGIKVRQIDAA